MKQAILVFFLMMIVMSTVQAAEVLREISPQNPKVNQPIIVTINILNDGSSTQVYDIEEIIPGDVQLLEPSQPYEIRQRDGISFPVLKWSVQLEPQKVTTLSYTIQANTPGQITFPPLKIRSPSSTEIILGESNEIIITCTPDNACSENENYLNCPEDCSTGATDGICNPIRDNICDGDCIDDPDCGLSSGGSKAVYFYVIGGIILLAIIVSLVRKFSKAQETSSEETVQTPAQEPEEQTDTPPNI